jgi:hypothetical protein
MYIQYNKTETKKQNRTLYHRKIENSALCVFPNHIIIALKICVLLESHVCANSEQKGVSPSWGWLCIFGDRLFPYHVTNVWMRTNLPNLILAGTIANFSNWVLSLVSSVPRIAVKWTCDQLDWFSFIIISFMDTNSTLQKKPLGEKVDSFSWATVCPLFLDPLAV